MQSIRDYLLPYVISNILFAISIIVAPKRPKWARAFFAAFFLWASLTNLHYASYSPLVYLEYGKLAFLPIYKDFINGYFSEHTTELVSLIAFFQMAISLEYYK